MVVSCYGRYRSTLVILLSLQYAILFRTAVRVVHVTTAGSSGWEGVDNDSRGEIRRHLGAFVKQDVL